MRNGLVAAAAVPTKTNSYGPLVFLIFPFTYCMYNANEFSRQNKAAKKDYGCLWKN